ncbi:MAG TPA: hypothetical protein VMZ30_05725 [Pyrinomonadaceae bacterium]|nr:hypothetical protein [Pyrinomonadaceae bacterium]
MKLCPKCAFIYEDDQGVCDMDGNELVPDPASGTTNQNVSPPKLNTSGRSRISRLMAVFAGAAVLTALLSLIYLGQRYQSRRSYAAIPLQSLSQPSARETKPQPPANSIANMATDAALSTTANDAAASTTKPPLTEAELASTPAAANALAKNSSGPVILRLTNGGSIKADDAGTTGNHVWYRQGGMVTFLKRSQVRTIERRSSSSPRSTVPASQGDKTATVAAAPAPNQLRIRRLETGNPKQQSRVTSFLKKTGQILSKPFKR